MMIGFPASTKSTKARTLVNESTQILSRDSEGGTVASLVPKVEALLKAGTSVILDNTNLSIEARKPFLECAARNNVPVKAHYMKTTIEDCQIRALHRMFTKVGTIHMTAAACTKAKDPNIFPVAALYAARKALEEPTLAEGFATVETVKVPVPTWTPDYHGKALFLDIDGTVRHTDHLEHKYPTKPEEVVLLHEKDLMRAKIDSYREQGYRLFGISNQSGIAKKVFTEEDAKACFAKTRELLEYTEAEFPILYCPHSAVPITCYCRKPSGGLAQSMIEAHHLDPHQCVMVGDRKTDETMAKRLGMSYISVEKFWI